MVMLRERVSRRPFVATGGQPSSQDGDQGVNGQKLVDSTLQEIRKRHSSSHRLSSQEIDHLLGDIRRSRSASCGAGGSSGRRSVSEGRGQVRPPPPLDSPPALPDELLPFGRKTLKEKKGLVSGCATNQKITTRQASNGTHSIFGHGDTNHKSSKIQNITDTILKQKSERENEKHSTNDTKQFTTSKKQIHNHNSPRDHVIVEDSNQNNVDHANPSSTDSKLGEKNAYNDKASSYLTNISNLTGCPKEAVENNPVDPALNMVYNLRQRLEAMTNDLERVQAAADRISGPMEEENQDDHKKDVNDDHEIYNKPNQNDQTSDDTEIKVSYDTADNDIKIKVTHDTIDNDTENIDDGSEEWEVASDKDTINIVEINEDECERLADERKEEGNQLYKQKNYREALHKYSEAIDLCPQCASFYGNRSACYLMLGQPRQALEDSKTATSLDPLFVKGWSRLVKCSIMLGDVVTARQAIQKAGEQQDQDSRNLETLERFKEETTNSINNKDYRRALYCLDKCLEIANYSLPLKAMRAECLAFLGRYAEASEAANGVLTLDNLNADAIYVRGLCLYYEDNVDRAFSHFQQVLRFAPDHTRAKEVYKKAKQLKQKKEEGNTAFKAGQLDSALKLYSEALEIDTYNRTTNSKLYFNRATVHAKLGKLENSIDDCTKAIELDSTYVKAYLRRAKSYMDTEQYEDAVRDYEHVFKTDKSNREYRQLLQNAKLELRKSKRKDYYKVLGIDKNANEEEIKKAYRKRAMVHHPDRHSGATEQEKKEHETKFKEVGEAYAILSDEKKRRAYDSGQDLDDMGGGGAGFHDIDPNTIFQAFFGGGGMGGHGHGGGGMGGGGMPGQHFSYGPGGGQSFSFQFG